MSMTVQQARSTLTKNRAAAFFAYLSLAPALLFFFIFLGSDSSSSPLDFAIGVGPMTFCALCFGYVLRRQRQMNEAVRILRSSAGR